MRRDAPAGLYPHLDAQRLAVVDRFEGESVLEDGVLD
jgi:hypothetical protein